MENQTQKKPRILCLHGFRNSGEILKKFVGRLPETVLEKLDLVFLDAPFPAGGKSALEGIFDPPYYEWFHSNEDYTEYTNFEECLAYVEDYMIKNGPFDGVLGFSMGAMLAATMPGMQAEVQSELSCVNLQGLALTKVPKIKFLIIISGAKLGGSKFAAPKLAANAFASPVTCPSLHFIGETDIVKPDGTALLDSFVDPVVINHSEGHTVPRLGFTQNHRARKEDYDL
ncbi:esterase AGAP003155-like isoform X2 [Carya illinoinensis]|uniref:esterase AGAP003155-like isoform X2 n=1 Tax=Carya illinoinensis TaxID=32201 RepID=UPI001C724CD8|nr:esterase AGAP003155-like isoform X2 [Carya illinoinensis]